jgi:anti-sigma regulatory factor (Ser/Thr protein kinase)
MDWFLDTTQPAAGRALREQFTAYLARHADDEADLSVAELVFAETVANAIEHSAGPVWVSLDWSEQAPVLAVHDLGEGFALDTRLPEDELAESGRGLFLVSHLTTELAVAAKRAGGSKVSARLPVRRGDEPSLDPPERRADALPSAAEASPEGTFGKESFLRALVVELAQAVEFVDGPATLETLVAQVGTNVGGRMEDEYRRARDIVDVLTPAQMADLYLRLKGAIHGDFYVIDASPQRIVLGNRACPFGDVVQRAPALCRMTSSVFGGIAARNAGQAVVRLEERIAVGDPECRVTVWLGPASDQHPGHRYRS